LPTSTALGSWPNFFFVIETRPAGRVKQRWSPSRAPNLALAATLSPVNPAGRTGFTGSYPISKRLRKANVQDLVSVIHFFPLTSLPVAILSYHSPLPTPIDPPLTSLALPLNLPSRTP